MCNFKMGSVAFAISAAFCPVVMAQTPAPAAAPVNQLQEVVVTAQRVESTVQKTPIAIQTISGNEVLKKGIQDTKDLSNLVPGLSITQTASGASFAIRGVGTYNEAPNADSGVAVSLDQMYFSRPYGPDMALYDMQRVEVLKGPQGTLYGRNATGGSINFISRKPILGVFGGEAAAEFGNYSAVKLNGAVNVPLSEDIAARIAFQSNRHKGYMKDGYNDADTQAVRLHLFWEPSDRTSLLLTGEYMHNGQKGPSSEPFVDNNLVPGHYLNNDPWAGGGSDAARALVNANTPPPSNALTSSTFLTATPYTPGPPNGTARYIADPSNCLPGCIPTFFAPSVQPGPYNTESNGFVNTTVESFRADSETNLGFATLSILPNYLLTNAESLFYQAGTPTYYKTKAEQSSLEARLTSPQNQPLTWIAGAFYEHEKQSYRSFNPSNFPSYFSVFNNPDIETTSKAVFAQASYKVLNNLTATAGVRYTKEDKSSKDFSSASLAYPGPPPGFILVPLTQDSSSANTYRLGLDWQVTPQNLLYTAYSTGFHAGGINGGGPPPTKPICTPSPSHVGPQLVADFNNCSVDITFKPEHLNAFSVGSKNRFMNNTIQLNIELYNWQYKDLQDTSLSPINDASGNAQSTTLFTANAGNSRIHGIDAEASWLFTRDDLLSLNINYNQSKYGEYITYFVIPPIGVGFANNYTGKHFLNAPDTVVSFGYQHTFHLANGGKLIPSVDGKYSSKIVYGYPALIGAPTTETDQKAYTKYNINLNYTAPDGKWDANLFVRNVGNVATISRALPNAPATGVPWVSLAAPRTFGANVSARF